MNFHRDEKTGLIDGVEYKKFPNGKIDWKAMIDPQYIVFNGSEKLAKEILDKYGAAANKLVYADVVKEKEVDERHLLVLLKGFMELAELRGYKSSEISVVHVTPNENVTAECRIEWLPNEEETQYKVSSGTADATMENTGGFGYLAAIAGNRAFVRAVKNGLSVYILGNDEIAKKDAGGAVDMIGAPSSAINPLSPQGTLQKAAEDLKYTFEQVKKGAAKYKDKMKSKPEEIEAWKGFGDVPPPDCMSLIGLLRKKEEKPNGG